MKSPASLLLSLPLLALAPAGRAGLITASATAPVVDGDDIAMLNTAGSYDTGGDEGHIWSNRPVMGQTFTTLANPGGYQLTSVTLQNFNNTVANNAATWTVRVGTVSGNTFTPLASETSNTPVSYVPLDFLTFTFTAPVALAPNTVYGFDWGSSGNGFVTVNNADGNYAGGTNFRHGANSTPADTALLFPGDDRVFHANLTQVPEPSTAVLLGLGMLALARRRRGKVLG